MAFKKGQNPNHPRKGASIKVDPIRDLAVIAQIKKNLLDAKQYRNYCLFVLGINTAWRANELLSITVGQVRYLKPGDGLELKQSKNKKYRCTPINKAAYSAIQLWLKHYRGTAHDNAPLFPSRQFGALGVPAVCNLVKRWCQEAGAHGRFGSHSLRKSWGFHQRKTFGTPLALICRALGHSSEQQTMRYIGLQNFEVRSLFDLIL
jgi:integrase